MTAPLLPLTSRTSPLEVPPGHLFGHPTRFVETWAPEVEHVLLDGYTVPACDFSIVPAGDETPSYWRQHAPKLTRLDWRLKNGLRLLHDEKLGKPVALDGELVYDARWIPSANVAHILEAVGARLLHARALLARAGAEDRIRLVATAGLPRWAERAFELLGVDVVSTNGRVRGRVVRLECRETCSLLPEVYDRTFPGYTTDTPPKVFLSRKGTRTLENEDEVWELLKARGYARCYFEDEPVERQWSIGRNAVEIVAIHGAAMSSLVFNRRGLEAPPGDRAPRLVELFTPGWMPNFFRTIAAAFRLEWAGVRGRITPEQLRDLDFREGNETRYEVAPFTVSPRSLERAMAHLGMR